MQLSAETLEGLHITGKYNSKEFNLYYNYSLGFVAFIVKSFVEMSKYLLKNSGDHFLLSERLSQDPLENYFGRQRCRGGRNDNPNLQQCLNNAAALRVQGSVALDPIRGNCRRKRQLVIDEAAVINSAPLPKRKRNRSKKI